ncbi:hypothetical protein [Cohnella soli]|uniref:Uncharacterized protein n=1 Tax=Cohnella soli TaxID=425005 RepID=A0ABW0HSN1_9BACL
MPIAIVVWAGRAALMAAVTAIAVSLQGCMAGSRSISAMDALALSASALAGSENYAFSGELSRYDTSGDVGSRIAFEGKVTDHGNLKMQWKPSELSVLEADDSTLRETYRPLQLLKVLRSDRATASYEEKPTPTKPVQLAVRLDDAVAKQRMAEELRKQLSTLRSMYAQDTKSNKGGKALAILDEADAKLEDAIKSLKVQTVCYWTADPRSWFPFRLKEETELSYMWEGKALNEKRRSETKFHNGADGVTIKGSDD